MKKILSVLSLGLFAATVASAQAGSSPSPAGLTQIRQAWMAAANAKDAAGIAALYTDDALLMPPNSPAVKGRAAIQSFFKGLLDQGARDVVLGGVGGALTADSGYEAGTFSVTMGPANAAPASDKGKYLLTVKKGSDGKWRINHDIFNSDLPCTPPAPTK